MTQKVPQPFESSSDAQSLFDELVGQASTQSSQPSGFSLSGFSSDAVLNLFKNETNAMLKGEISKIKDLQSLVDTALELRLSTWKDRLGGAMDKIDEKIQVIANIEAPQKGQEKRKEDEERRPIAFALLKAIRSGLLEQSQELSQLETDLIATKLQTHHASLVADLLEFLQLPKDPMQIDKKFEQFLQSLFVAFNKIYGKKGFAGLGLFIQNLQNQLPKHLQELFIKKFLEQFQKFEMVQMVFEEGALPDLQQLLQLHEILSSAFSSNAESVLATLIDTSGAFVHYFRGKSLMNQNMVLPQGTLSAPLLSFLVSTLVAKGVVNENEVPLKTGLPDVDFLATLMGKDPLVMTADEKMRLLCRFTPVQEEMTPSSTLTLLLARLIEKKTNMSLPEVAKKELFDALQLHNTSFDAKYELKSSPHDMALLLKHLLADNDEVLQQVTHYKGYSLALIAEPISHLALYLATNQEKHNLEPVVKLLMESLMPVPMYGLAFTPYQITPLDEDAVNHTASGDDLEKQLRRFEGKYHSEELSLTWSLVVQKNRVRGLEKEYWGLQVVGMQSLFFIPTEIGDETAKCILAERPVCTVQFSKNQFVLQDPVAGVRDLLFKRRHLS